MTVLFAGFFWTGLLNALLVLTGIFLILLVLIQRGRGGGLIGALGGSGGSSPFGSRAGDTFTRITIGVAIFWGLLAAIQIYALRPSPAPAEQPRYESPASDTSGSSEQQPSDRNE